MARSYDDQLAIHRWSTDLDLHHHASSAMPVSTTRLCLVCVYQTALERFQFHRWSTFRAYPDDAHWASVVQRVFSFDQSTQTFKIAETPPMRGDHQSSIPFRYPLFTEYEILGHQFVWQSHRRAFIVAEPSVPIVGGYRFDRLPENYRSREANSQRERPTIDKRRFLNVFCVCHPSFVRNPIVRAFVLVKQRIIQYRCLNSPF